MKASLAALSILVLSGSVPDAQTFAELDEETAAELRVLVQEVEHSDAPGGLIGVLQRGEPCFLHTFGLADLAERRPIARETVFYLASAAKPFTAACVLHAAESGKLALDDAVTRHVTGLAEGCGDVKLRQLLDHRSGLADVYDLAIGLDLGPGVLASNAAAVELLRKLPGPDFAPGTRFRYSNSGYVLLAETLRAATGKTLPEYAREQLFEPLGMTSARFAGEPELALLPRARSYGRDGSAWKPLEIPTGLIGPGGLWASFDDIARWERAAFEGGWGTEKLRRRLVTPPELLSGESLHPAFGPYTSGAMVGEDRGLPVIRVAGEAFGFGVEILRHPEQETTVIVLSNADLGLDDLAERAAEVVLREELQDARASLPESAAIPDDAGYGRFWREEDTGILWVLTKRADSLVAASLGDWKLELVPAKDRRLEGRNVRAPVELRFEPRTGAPERMQVLVAGVAIASCRPHPFPPAAQPALDEYVGEFVLQALGATLELRAARGGLEIVQHRALLDAPPFVLPPFVALGDDLFACDAGAQMQFRRDADGEVTGLRLDLNRASGLVLERR